ncbi:MAG: hypothetical protein ABIM99_04190 [Candidatus Dojkabacteria bacterium]
MSNKKIAAIVITLIILIVSCVGITIFILMRNTNPPSNTAVLQTNKENQQTTKPEQTQSNQLQWKLGENGYVAEGNPPACTEPIILTSPVNLSDATSILYPGQTRGGNYKPHGGVRFDNNTSNVQTVSIPADAFLVAGTRFLAEGEIQYSFDFITPCGIIYRLGHLRELTDKFQFIVDKFPEATTDSRVTFVNPPVEVFKDEVLAIKIGIIGTSNTFLDWGVYDLRKLNEASKDPAYAASHDIQLAQHAVCWLDMLAPSDTVIVDSLPAGDPTSGKNSDYCK